MRSSRLLRRLSRTPVQTFILCPLLVVAFELVRERGGLAIVPAGFALILFAARALWFHRRVLEDETDLQEMFGAAYLDYQRRVKRWIPGLL